MRERIGRDTHQTAVRLPPLMWAWLQQKASAEDLSLAQVIRKGIRRLMDDERRGVDAGE